MKKTLFIVFGLLLILTVATAFVSGFSAVSKVASILILVLAGLKFLLVAFQFMEIKKAHLFWRTSLSVTLLLFMVIILCLKLKS